LDKMEATICPGESIDRGRSTEIRTSSAAKEGCNYFTYNIPNTICNDCGHIDKRYLHKCPNCGSENVDYMTRIIGYLKRVSNFSMPRQEEAQRRFYAGQSQYKPVEVEVGKTTDA
jgi:anaerobic ribonucleoside-triphosphate reductase